MSASRAVLAKIAEAQATGGGTAIRDGRYRFEILNLLLEQKYTGMCFIAELKVVNAEKVFEDIEPNKPGTTCSYVVNLDGAGKLSAPGNIKAFVLALLGDNGDVSNQEFQNYLASLVEPSQPARGMHLDSSTWRKFSRSGKNTTADAKGRPPMVMNSWTYVEQTDAEVKARRAELDKK